MLTKIIQQHKDCVEDTYRADFDLPRPKDNYYLHENSSIVHGIQDRNTLGDEDIDGYSDCHGGQHSNNCAIEENYQRRKAAATKVYDQEVLRIHS
jgi:hypothetical protein